MRIIAPPINDNFYAGKLEENLCSLEKTGISDVRSEQNIHRADRQLRRFEAYLADLGGEEDAEMEEL